MDDAAVVAVIQGLSAADFDKSMTSMADHRVWQDVLQTERERSNALCEIHARCPKGIALISFKEA